MQSIEMHLIRSGLTAWSQAYVGITNDPNRRLFQEHNVEQNGVWIYCPAISEEVARATEEAFLDAGAQGGKGGGTGAGDCIYVYAYKITNTTIQ